jgi:hypothetical protein
MKVLLHTYIHICISNTLRISVLTSQNRVSSVFETETTSDTLQPGANPRTF